MLSVEKITVLKKHFFNIIILMLLIWFIELVNIFTNHNLVMFGIYPRTLDGLLGIPLSPFIHNGIGHVLSNSLPLLILSVLVFIIEGNRFWLTTISIVLFSGLLVWIFSRSSYHVGASGLIFGYFGIIIMNGYIDRNFKAIIISFLTLFLYGSAIIYGLLPISNFTSYESHIFGLLSGLIIKYFLK